MKAVVIVPTYNERLNIGALLTALQEQFQKIPHDMHILVVDDHSPDGTAQVVQALQAHYPNVHLIEGEKAGLGVAYIRGMRHALQSLHAEVVFEMDADFSHKPEDVRRLMAEIDAGADFVIGSRYVPGGSLPEAWGLLRQLNSRMGNFVARYVTGIYLVRDCTAGFRAIRTSLLRRIHLENLRVQGYAFQVALLHAAVVERAQIKEIPVDFTDRQQGESKLGLSDVIEFLLNAWWIRFQSVGTFTKFGTVGASGVLVNLGLFTLLLAAGVDKYVASPWASALSIVWNFLLHNYWTFRWRKTKDRTRLKGLKFNLVLCLAMVVSYGTFVALSFVFPHVTPYAYQLVSIVPTTLINYFLNSYWTFRNVERCPPGAMQQSSYEMVELG
jgi:dolichol-phosphate mannosyltransferase